MAYTKGTYCVMLPPYLHLQSTTIYEINLSKHPAKDAHQGAQM